jgi:hypothetical protein
MTNLFPKRAISIAVLRKNANESWNLNVNALETQAVYQLDELGQLT